MLLQEIIQQQYGTIPITQDNVLYFNSPNNRDEVDTGDSINISVEAVNASSVSFEYQDIDGVWSAIGSGTNSSDDTWVYNSWSPSEVVVRIKAIASFTDADDIEATVLLYSNILYDTFTDADSTAIGSHTPDSSWGSGWTVDSGAWEIQSNKLTCTDTDTNYDFLITDGGLSCIIEFTISQASSNGGDHIIAVKFVDEDNWVRVKIDSSEVVTVGHLLAGSYTQYVSDSSLFNYGDTIRIYVIDDYIHLVNTSVDPDLGNTMQSYEIEQHATSTKYGIARPNESGGGSYYYDSFKLIAFYLPTTTTDVNYTTNRQSSLILTKNTYSFDVNGISSPSMMKVGNTIYNVFSCITGTTSGLSYATADVNDPHNWTRHNALILTDSDSPSDTDIIDCTIHYDGATWWVIYSELTTGNLKYATGTTLGSLTKQGDFLTAFGGLFLRHPHIFYHAGKFYLYIDTRRDSYAGWIGDVYVGEATSVLGLIDANYIEVIVAPGFNYDVGDITAPDVRYNSSTGYYEMLYSSFNAGSEPFFHEICLAVSKNPLNQFVRVDNNPLIPTQDPSDIDYVTTTPCWYPQRDDFYYTCKTSGGSKDGFTYATIS